MTIEETYPDGMQSLLAQGRKRRVRLVYQAGEALPPTDTDLDALIAMRVPLVPPPLPEHHSSFARKRFELMTDLAGHTELALVNALLIANLRKRVWPRHAPALFNRIWGEKGSQLLAELPTRWLISSVITFADHGLSEADRRIGQSLNILFSLMKLYEAERQYAGAAADTPFPLTGRKVSPLPLGMPQFGLVGGDLEAHFFLPILRDIKAAPSVGPLAHELINRLNQDPGNLFRRLGKMRDRRKEVRSRKTTAP